MDNLVARVHAAVQPYTMVPLENLVQTMQIVIDVVRENRPGDLVECGTWKGGSSFAMLLIQKYVFGRIVKPVWMFDSFQGLPEAEERDGPMALAYQRNIHDPEYKDNCRVSFSDVKATARQMGFADEEAILVPGWFNQTVPLLKDALRDRGIAFLRIDCDWYEPVSYVLNELCPFVPDEGRILLDDYYAFDGCARATHDYLSKNDLSWRLRSVANNHGAWIIKRPYRKDGL
ncbi:TylF/MycF/NovP-related O-methyltransferase [uncultured Methylobacterium sp.]|jgi:O-methyltransferase|uniref:TylF/MycF/NovP-related O-methyltransferase n=1 Tax=uncultured Methylobacterium sp. TaxID=157278 RepID=UPI002603FB21|nr:TylF/MycF/NovP-related O-methyltransferase [uncultured Methylobacterium sp.]